MIIINFYLIYLIYSILISEKSKILIKVYIDHKTLTFRKTSSSAEASLDIDY